MDLNIKVYTLLREGHLARQKLAQSMLDGFKANAFEKPTTPEDIAEWEVELANATADLEALDHA